MKTYHGSSKTAVIRFDCPTTDPQQGLTTPNTPAQHTWWFGGFTDLRPHGRIIRRNLRVTLFQGFQDRFMFYTRLGWGFGRTYQQRRWSSGFKTDDLQLVTPQRTPQQLCAIFGGYVHLSGEFLRFHQKRNRIQLSMSASFRNLYSTDITMQKRSFVIFYTGSFGTSSGFKKKRYVKLGLGCQDKFSIHTSRTNPSL